MISVMTGLIFAFLAYRGTGSIIRAGLAGALAFGLVMVGPILILTLAAYLITGDRAAWGVWSGAAIIAGNAGMWAWALWQRN